MLNDDAIGARIAQVRRARGLTQVALAQRAGISESLARSIEAPPESTNYRPVTGGTLAAVAAVLGVPATRLTGQPYLGADTATGPHARVAELSAELLTHDLPAELLPDRPPLPVAELETRVRRVQFARHSGDVATVSELLPDVLAEVQRSALAQGPSRAMAVLQAQVYDATASHAYTLGYPDLAVSAAQRMATASAAAGEPGQVAIGRGLIASYLARRGRPRDAYRVTSAALDGLGTPGDARGWSAFGFLHLQAALDCARAGDRDRTWEHHEHAEAAGQRVGADMANYFDRWFGPANVRIWGVALGLELWDEGSALSFAADTAPRVPLGYPAARLGQLHLDTGRAYVYAGRPSLALESLRSARSASPQQMRESPMFREALVALAGVDRRPGAGTLRELASWAGLPD